MSVVHLIEYFYSADGFLAKIIRNEDGAPVSEERFVRSDRLTIQERDDGDAVTRKYTWGVSKGGGIGGLLNMSDVTGDYRYMYDGKGNVVAVMKNNQDIVVSYRYDEFGNRIVEDINPLYPNFKQTYQFSTKRFDDATGLSYYGYRYYNASAGMWMSRDPLGEAGGINLYGFVGNNGVNAIDPWGLWSVKASVYYGYGGSLSIGKSNGQWFVRAGAGVGIGGGVKFNPSDRLPGTPSKSNRAFLGASGWLGCSVGPLSGGFAGSTGVGVQKDSEGVTNLEYVEEGSIYGSVKGDAGRGLAIGVGINLVDVGFAW